MIDVKIESTAELIHRLRMKLHKRGDHHSRCDWRDGKQCNCYGWSSQESHAILDEIEARISKGESK